MGAIKEFIEDVGIVIKAVCLILMMGGLIIAGVIAAGYITKFFFG
jgi:hypothetical protein